MNSPLKFDLSKYDALSEFTYMDWAKAISKRLLLQMLYDGQHSDWLQEMSSEIQDSPLNVESKWYPHLESSPKVVDNLKISDVADLATFHPSVVSRSIRSQPFLEELIAPGTSAFINSLQEDERKSRVKNVSRLIHNDHNNDGRAVNYLTLNMEASDSVLKKEFDKWLSKERESYPVTRESFRKAGKWINMNSWVQHKQLEYFDLEHLALTKGVSISQSEIVATLWPENPDIDASYLRKTTIENQKRVFAKSTIRYLYRKAIESENCQGGKT